MILLIFYAKLFHTPSNFLTSDFFVGEGNTPGPAYLAGSGDHMGFEPHLAACKAIAICYCSESYAYFFLCTILTLKIMTDRFSFPFINIF